MTDDDAARLGEALRYATWLHRGQTRKATPVPYVSHLLGVASLVLEHGGTTDEAIAAVLHDAVEDQGGIATADDIRHRFGDPICAIVLGCTDGVPGEPRDASTWRARKERYLAHLLGASPSVLLVSAADKLHNARSILRDLRDQGDALWRRFSGGKDGTLAYYRGLARAFHDAPSTTPAHRRLFEELERTVDAMHAAALGG